MTRSRFVPYLPACVLVVAAVLAGCSSASEPGAGGDGNGGNGNGNGNALSVVSVTPRDGATDVATAAPVLVTFSGEVDATTVTTSSFTVVGATGTITVGGTSATFTPAAAYANGATVTVRVQGVRDKSGATMASSFTSSFAVVAKAATPPSADAGADRMVSAGAQVALDGSKSGGTDVSYTWKQLAGPSVGALSGTTPSFKAPTDVSRLDFELAVSGTGPTDRDTVSILVVEDSAHAYFVAKSGSDGNAGSRAAPFATISRAIAAADANGNGGDVYIAAGTYTESIVLKSRVSLYGGFVDASWRRDVTTSRAVINGGSIAMRGSDANDLALDGISVRAADAGNGSLSSIALLLHDSRGVTVRGSRLQTGAGAHGGDGAPGTDPGRTDAGNNGLNAAVCPPSRTGGSGGSSTFSRSGGGGGTGGLAGGFGGSDGQGSSGGNGGSGGGAFGGNGRDGSASTTVGTDGVPGAALTGLGTLTATDIVLLRGTNGSAGGNGWGGGGGGGGGGGLGCGGGGGGGGAGGQGASAGTGGFGGGHSVGVALSGTSTVQLVGSDIVVGTGGRGGVGGAGGIGGAGGLGGNGGNNNASGGSGGDGANGTRGGDGGGGAGGNGGSSIGILESPTASSTRTGGTISRGTPGTGGAGGTRAGTRAGANGIDGVAADVEKTS